MISTHWYAAGQFKSIYNLEVFFRREGKGETLLCIHGFPSSSWDFSFIWDKLSQQFDVIAHDMIGLGKSSKPAMNITVKLQADVIEQLLIHNHIKQAHILAHDLGDTVAQELLARQMEGTSKIQWLSCVFLNGGIFPETHQPLLIQKLLLSPVGTLMAKLTTKTTFRKNMHHIFSQSHPPTNEFIEETWQLLASNNGKVMIPKLITYMNEREKFRARWVSPLVNQVVPIRLINGIEDPISGLHAAKRFDEIIPDADITLLENTGHYPHVENPQAVLESFLQFHKLLNS